MSRALWVVGFVAACHTPMTAGDPDAAGLDPDVPSIDAGGGIAVEPAAITLPAGTDQFFVATPAATTWAVVEPGGGSIDATGRYQAPDVPGTYHVTASDGVHTTTGSITVIQMSLAVLTGALGGSGGIDGVGQSARFYHPHAVASDGAGHVFVADLKRLRRIDVATHAVTTLAGTISAHGATTPVDGIGTAATFGQLRSFVFDPGTQTLYIADDVDQTIRAFDVATDTVTTVAGKHGIAGTTNGIGTAATFSSPYAVCLRGTTLYVADGFAHTIRTLNTVTHEVKLLAGHGATSGFVDSADPLAARFYDPLGLACGASTVYVADAGNHAIRTIDQSGGPNDGTVATLVGGTASVADGPFATAGVGWPTTLTLDPTESILYVSHRTMVGTRLRALDLIAKQTSTLALAPEASSPQGIAQIGTMLWMADDVNSSVATLDLGTHATVVIAGRSGPASSGVGDGDFASARFSYAYHLASHGNDLFVTDAERDRGLIRTLSLTGGTVERYTGQASTGPIQDGPRADASLATANAIAVSADGTVWTTDPSTVTVRAIDVAGAVTTPYSILYTPGIDPYSIISHVDGVGSAARFEYPTGIVAVGDMLILGDLGGVFQSSPHPNTPRSATIRAIDLPTGMVSTIAGSGFGNADGIGTAAMFETPWGFATDGGHLIWIADETANTIRQLDLATGAVTTIAGEPDVYGANDGIGSAAHFDRPVALAYDGHGSLYVADANAQTIRRIWLASRAVSTIAGTPYAIGVRTGPLQTATLSWPSALAITPSGSLVVTGEQAVLELVAE